MEYLGDFAEDATIRFKFTTHDKSGGAVAPSDAFEAADLKIYKNDTATPKATTNGVTMTSPFNSVTGLHHVSIDASNDTGDAGFWTTTADYAVVLDPDTETVDTESVVRVLAEFSIENRYMRGTNGANTVTPNTVTPPSAAAIRAEIDANSTQLIAIVADTDELQSDWTNAGRLDAILDAIAADVVNIDGAAMRGTDSALLASSAPANFSVMSISAITGRVDVGNWVGQAVTLSAGNKPDVNVDSWGDVLLATTNPLPNAAAGANGGLPTVDASNYVAGIQGTLNQFDDLNDVSAADVNAQVDIALADIGLDHLIAVADPGGLVANNSLLAKLVSASATAVFADFVNTTDSLQAIRDKLTDIETDTGQIGAAGAGLTSVGIGTGGIVAASFDTGAIDAAALDATAVAEIAGAVLPAKNVAFADIPFLMVDSSDVPQTGKSVTVTRSIDGGGTFNAVTGTVSETGNGAYQLDASAADMNGDVILFRATAAGCVDSFFSIRTAG